MKSAAHGLSVPRVAGSWMTSGRGHGFAGRRHAGALGVVATALLVCVAAPSQAAFPGVNGRIAVTEQKWRQDPCDTTRPWDPHACPDPVIERSRTVAVLPNGRGRLVLRELDRGLDGYPALAWSPNGRMVAFDTWERIGTVRRDGSGRRLLPLATAQDLFPTWSPDGRRLAFVNSNDASRVPGDIPDGLYTIRPDGSRLRRIYFGGFLGAGLQPDWSPDGSRIAFLAATRDAPENFEIFTIKANGRGLRRLTRFGPHHGGGVGAPKWSPDGRRITFIDNNDLYVMDQRGHGLRRIVDTPKRDPASSTWTTLDLPSWLPRLR